MKHCGKCGKDKPEDAFRMKGGRLYSMCRRCDGLRKSVARVKPLPDQKRCAKCEQVKAIDSFAIFKGRPHSYCKQCRSSYNVDRDTVRGRSTSPKKRPVVEELWPRKLGEALLDVRMNKWSRATYQAREFCYITRAGNLVPIIEVRYDEAA
jgi:hypothetical protein